MAWVDVSILYSSTAWPDAPYLALHLARTELSIVRPGTGAMKSHDLIMHLSVIFVQMRKLTYRLSFR
jgi:hypothetical protein